MSYKPGSVIGDYVVVATVGAGGMGTVYKVQHAITKRIEAIKLLASGRTESDQEQRFIREMQVQARLHHPNIAAVYNAFRYYDEFFLVLEFIEGESLESILSRGRLPLSTALHYTRQALFALGYAHAHGVVHRDIAPSNMIITPDGTVKLTDFGLAKTATDIRLTHSGAPLGSPWYMSPEQVRGNSRLDARSDIYSLGAVLYEMATGAKAFDMSSTFDVMRAQVENAPLPPLARAPDLPQALNDLILTALQKDPDARFQSAEQFYAALETLQPADAPMSTPVSGPNPSRPAALPVHTPVPAAPLRQSTPRQRAPRFLSHPLVQTALGSAACGLLMFGGYTGYSMVRAAAAPPPPAIVAGKPSIPAPPDFLLPAQPAEPAPDSGASLTPPAQPALDPEPAPAPRKVRKVAVRTAAPLVFSPQTEPLTTPAPPPKPVALPSPPVVAAATPASGPALNNLPPAVREEEAAENPPLITGPEPAAHDKKDGNRFFRALHRVVPFRKDSPPPAADVPK